MSEFIWGSPFLHLFLLLLNKPPLIWRQENYSHRAIYKIIGDNIIYLTIHQHHRKPPPKKLTISSQLSFLPSSVGYIVPPSPYKNIASPMNIISLVLHRYRRPSIIHFWDYIYILPLKLPMDGGNIQFVACIHVLLPFHRMSLKIAYSDKSKANLKGNPHSRLFINLQHQFIYQWHFISCKSHKMYVNPSRPSYQIRNTHFCCFRWVFTSGSSSPRRFLCQR